MTSYRVRTQSLTGKLILQYDMTVGWADVKSMPGEFALLEVEEYQRLLIRLEMQADRIARYERRARAQTDARARKATKTGATG